MKSGLLVSVLLMILSPLASGSSPCVQLAVPREMLDRRVTAVFTGTVVSMSVVRYYTTSRALDSLHLPLGGTLVLYPDSEVISLWHVKAVLAVEQVWKGPLERTIVIHLPDESHDALEIQGKYLVYAKSVSTLLGEIFMTDRWSTKNWTEAKQDIGLLGEPLVDFGWMGISPQGLSDLERILQDTTAVTKEY